MNVCGCLCGIKSKRSNTYVDSIISINAIEHTAFGDLFAISHNITTKVAI